MASDFISGRLGDDYNKREHQAKVKFDSLNLTNAVSDIYYSSIKKASEDYFVEIENKRKKLLETSYTEAQALERYNYYANKIRIQNEEDDCYYRQIKNNFIINFPDAPLEDLQEIIIKTLCIYLKSEELNYINKLRYIEELPKQIYESNKIHRKFLFFKASAEKILNKELINNNEKKKSQEKNYLPSLFKEIDKYKQIIELLKKEDFIHSISKITFDWKGKVEETSLNDLKLLGTLGYVLKRRNYFHNNLTKKQIAEALTNTFPNLPLSNTYYGRIESQLSNCYSGSKEEDYISVFYFIDSI